MILTKGVILGGGAYLKPGASPAFVNYSASFNGTSQYISAPASSAWAFGTGDFTIEWWQYMTSQPSNPRVFSVGNYSTASIAVSIESASGIFYVWENSGVRFSYNLSTGGYLNQWIHFAISRVSGTTRVFKNGSLIGSSYSDSNNISDSSHAFTICQESTPTSNSYFPGYISNFRVLKGTGLYSSNFTPPTSHLTAIANTQLLTCQNSTLIDNSPNNFTITNNNGATTTSSTVPFSS